MSKSRYSSSSSLFLVEWLVRIRSMLFSSYPSSFSMLSSLSLLSSSTSSSFTSRHSCRRHRRPPRPQSPCCWCCGWSDSEVLVHEHVQVHAQVNKKRKKIRGGKWYFFSGGKRYFFSGGKSDKLGGGKRYKGK